MEGRFKQWSYPHR